jgi:hypothetical protein
MFAASTILHPYEGIKWCQKITIAQRTAKGYSTIFEHGWWSNPNILDEDFLRFRWLPFGVIKNGLLENGWTWLIYRWFYYLETSMLGLIAGR